MRNYYSLIKKTTERLSLAKGTSSIAIPKKGDIESISRFKLFGQTQLTDDGKVRSFGESEDGSHFLITVTGRNLMSGETYAQLYKAVSSGTCSISGGYFNFIANAASNGKTVIGPEHIAFKSGTQYTLCGKFAFVSSGAKQTIQIKVNYTDGTSEQVQFSTSQTQFYGTFVTAYGKTVARFTTNMNHNGPNRISLADFGIFEGAYSTYEEVGFEPYFKEEHTVELLEPLRSLGPYRDEFDLESGTVLRKIIEVSLSSDCDISETEHEGVFAVKTDEYVRLCVADGYEVGTLDELLGSECGFYLKDFATLYIKLPGASDIESFTAALDGLEIKVFCLMAMYLEELIKLPTLVGDSARTITFGSDILPRRVFMIYKKKGEI